MRLIRPEDWRSTGIEDLEPSAWKALKEPGNTCVVAGPGGGKTEFLAQRAAYLLQTGLCPSPKRILAISFKRDAARNLAERIAERCAPEQATRLDSRTFDAFAKSLIDRFLPAIPAHWRPDRDYRIALARTQDYRYFLDGIDVYDAPKGWVSEARAIKPKNFEKNYLAVMRLGPDIPEPKSGKAWAVCQWWEKNLRGNTPSILSFVMIGRLAELLLRTNMRILEALRLTYPFVFLDEFQDTTYGQYSLVKTAFLSSESVLTAVGDDKQRIMGWAGARPDAFKKFESDFDAKRIPLLANYRSSKELVRIQHVVAQAIEPDVALPESHVKEEITGEVSQIWQFPSQEKEANGIANRIAADIQTLGLGPRDFALLVRQKADDYENDLKAAFANRGLRIRNESRMVGKVAIQDLLAEELTQIVLPFLWLGAKARAGAIWTTCVERLTWLRGIDPEDERECRRVAQDLGKFAQDIRQAMNARVPSEESAPEVLRRVIEFVGAETIRQAIREYVQGERFEDVLESLHLFLQECADGGNSWSFVLDVFEGADQVPLMTVHKSKSLEFHTMIFVGLDDDAWWSFKLEDVEGLSTFFVALSRARQRSFFSYCPSRGGRERIRKLYELLQEARVPERKFSA